MKIKKINLMTVIIFLMGWTNLVVAEMDCRQICENIDMSWQYPGDEASCISACKSCLYKQGGQEYWCTDDALPTCTCVK